MGYNEDWAEVQKDPRWAALPPAVKAKKVREFARDYVRPAGKEAVRSFIGQHIAIAPKGNGAPTTIQGAQMAGSPEGRGTNLTGALQAGKNTVQLPSVLDGGFWQGAGQSLANTNPLEVLEGIGQGAASAQFLNAPMIDTKTGRTLHPGRKTTQSPTKLAATQATTAAAEALNDPAGLAVDAVTLKAGSLLAKPLLKAAAPAARNLIKGATVVGASGVSGGIQGGSYAALTGRPDAALQEAAVSAGIAAALGLPGAFVPKPAPRGPVTLNRQALRMPDPDLTAARRDAAVIAARAKRKAAEAQRATNGPDVKTPKPAPGFLTEATGKRIAETSQVRQYPAPIPMAPPKAGRAPIPMAPAAPVIPSLGRAVPTVAPIPQSQFRQITDTAAGVGATPPIAPLFPGQRIGPMPSPADTINPIEAQGPFPLQEILETIDAQARVQGGAAPAPYQPGLPIEPQMTVPTESSGVIMNRPMDDLPILEGRMNPRRFKIDAEKYQFKASNIDMNNTGVTERLKGDVEYNQNLASRTKQTIHLMKNGDVNVVDGHQRTNKAHEAIANGQDVGDVDIRILREVDGWTVEKARNYGAWVNLADGTGSPIDAAKVMRDGGLSPAQMRALPKKGPEAESFVKGREIAKLGNEAYHLAINMMPDNPKQAAMIASQVGQRVKTPEIQAAILREFINDPPSGELEVSSMIDQLLADGFDTLSTDQLSMFGREVLLQSNARPIAKILVDLSNDIKADRATEGRLLRSEGRVTAIEGNTVNKEATAAKLEETKRRQAELALLGTQDQDFRNALTEIAKTGANKKQKLTLARQALEEARARRQASQAPTPEATAVIPEAPKPLTPVTVKTADPAPEGGVFAEPLPADTLPDPDAPKVSSDQMGFLQAFIQNEAGSATVEGSLGIPQMKAAIDLLAKLRKDKTPEGIAKRKAIAAEVSQYLSQRDALLRLVMDESGSATPEGALGLPQAQAAIRFLRDAWRRLVGGESVNQAQVERAALVATASERRGRKTPEQIRAEARERAAAIRAAAGIQREVRRATQAPQPVTPETPAPVMPDAPAPVAPVVDTPPPVAPEPIRPPAPEPAPAVTPDPIPAPRVTEEAPATPAPDAPEPPAPSPRSAVAAEPGLRRFEAWLRKQNFSPEMEAKLRQDLRDGVASSGWDDVVPQQSYIDTARQMGLDESMLRVPGRGETVTREVYAKLSMELKGIDQQIRDAQARVADLDANGGRLADRDAAEANLERLNQDARAILDVIIPARSQDGRNLAFHRWMAEQSFDEAFWVSRARRTVNGDTRVAVPHETEFRDILRQGREAEGRMNEAIEELTARGIMDHGIDPRNPELDNMPPAGAEDTRNIGRELLNDEMGQANFIGAFEDWLFELRDRRGNRIPQNDPHRRLGMYPSADPDVIRLVRQGRLAAAEVRAARVELAIAMRNMQRMPISEVITTMRKGLLLASVRVVQMNVTGGVANVALAGASRNIAAPVDMFLSMFSGGRRTVTSSANPMNWGRVAHASQRAATRGVREALQVLRHGMTHDQLRALDFNNEMVTGNRWYNRVFDGTVNAGFRLAMAPDRIMRVFAIESSLMEQARIVARQHRRANPSVDVRRRTQEIYNQLTDPTATPAISAADAELMRLTAAADGDYVSLTNRTVAGEVLGAVHNGIRREELAAYRNLWRGAVDLQAPFKQVPSAAFSQMLDYSGVSLPLKALAHAGDVPRILSEGLSVGQQRAISLAIGRAGVGWGFILAGMFLKNNGFDIEFAGAEATDMEGAYDRETKEVNEAAGRTPNSIKFKAPWMEKARWIPVSQIPGGNLLALGATVGQLKDNWLETYASVGVAAAKVSMDTPALQGASNTIKALEEPEEGGSKLISSLAGSFVPTGVADIATAMDPSRAAPELRKEFPGNIQDAVSARVPGLRNGLPRKQDALGQPIEAPTGGAAFNRFQGREAKEDSNPMLAELVNLNKELPTGEKMKITKANTKLTINKVAFEMPPEVAREYTALVGELVGKRIGKMTSHPKYKAADAAQRKEWIDKVETDTKRAVTAAIKGEGAAPSTIRDFIKAHGPALKAEYRKAKAAQ